MGPTSPSSRVRANVQRAAIPSAKLARSAEGAEGVEVVDMPTLVVNPWHWLTEDGHFLVDNPPLYRRMLRIARFIEYGGPLKRHETRETLIECKRRPKGRACVGLMWVVKTDDDTIVAHCVLCRIDEAFIHDWQETEWANGTMEPAPVAFSGEERTTH